MSHPLLHRLSRFALFGVLLMQGCAAPRDVSVIERPTGGMHIDLSATSRLNREDICHALRYHVLDFNAAGQLEMPASNLDCFGDKADYRHQCQTLEMAKPGQTTPDQRLNCQIDAMRDAIAAGRPDGTPYTHLVLVVHGGLVSEDEGLRSAILATEAMSKDVDPDGPQGQGHYYPIFVVWRSGALPTYFEQSTRIEQGKRSPGFARAVAPLTIATDLARGVVREPRFGASEGLRLWNFKLRHQLSQGDGEFSCEKQKAQMTASSALATSNEPAQTQDATRTPFNVLCPDPERGRDGLLKRSLKTGAYALSTPLRVVTTPILLGPGQSAWENMQRRARGLVWRETDKRDQTQGDITPPAVVDGGLQVLFRSLLMPLTNGPDNGPSPYRLTLIGHSMGAIVVTEMLRLEPRLRFDNLVLMGAAVDMRGFVYALRSSQAVHDHHAQVYNLALHPDNEVFELSGRGAMPSGSLLQWIDEAYETPPTQLDRVLGKWTNLTALERTIPPAIAAHVTFKMFGFEQGEPQVHGAFNDLEMCYWRKSFWDASDWQSHRQSCAALLSVEDGRAP
ncbi:MAG: hypothetical protein IT492_18945 [Gammaproteobacteria bacterium]|nr:hypothetical protein [Gammaproteobacteria bacterium]